MAHLALKQSVVTYNLEINQEERLALLAALRYRATYADKGVAYGEETVHLIEALTASTN